MKRETSRPRLTLHFFTFHALQEAAIAREYIHPALNEEVSAIGGRYTLVKEARLSFHGREVLYLVGHAAFDTACCGVGGSVYALVPGFILSWKATTDESGLAVPQVEPIHDNGVQEQVRRVIEKREAIQQVSFL